MLLIPYRLEILFTKIPIINALFIAASSLILIFMMMGVLPDDVVEPFVLRNWSIEGLIGNIFLHGGLFHLLGNMVFLWVFGNAICSTVGNAAYAGLYILLGGCASIVHLLLSGEPALGASGAVNGVVGMSLVFFPVSKLETFYLFFIPFGGFVYAGKFAAKSYWMILFWLVFDILGVVIGGGHIAYWAHLGGFVAGIIVASLLIGFKAITPFDPTLMDILAGRTLAEQPSFVIKRHPPAIVEPQVQSLHRQWIGEGSEEEKKMTHHTLSLQQQWLGEAEPITERSDSGVERRTGDTVVIRRKEAVPKLRLLRFIRSDKEVNCYFVNDGDSVSDISIESSQKLFAEVHPTRILKKGEPGWIKFTGSGQVVPRRLEFRISFWTDGGERRELRLAISEEGKRIVAVGDR